MPETIDLFVPLAAADEPLGPRIERALGWARGSVGEVRVVRRALDARKGRPLGHRLRIVAARTDEVLGPVAPPRSAAHWPASRPVPRVVIVGSGPAGAWAALRLAEAGVPSTVIEQGKPVQPRRHDLARITRGELTPSSNYCFGEGGAGTYSDGKLYARAKDRAGVAEVLADLVRFGAPPEIEIEARPHVGSNRLPQVLDCLRAHLASLGVIYRFETSATGLRADRGRLAAVMVDGDEIAADVVVLAVGHSARAVYEWAAAADLALSRKPIAGRCADRTPAAPDRSDPVRARRRTTRGCRRPFTS